MHWACRSMHLYLNILARSNGRAAGKVIGAVSHALPIRSAKGVALKRKPHPSAVESNADLNRLLENAVPETAEQITAFFQAIEEARPVPSWLDRDFKGEPVRMPVQTYFRAPTGYSLVT